MSPEAERILSVALSVGAITPGESEKVREMSIEMRDYAVNPLLRVREGYVQRQDEVTAIWDRAAKAAYDASKAKP